MNKGNGGKLEGILLTGCTSTREDSMHGGRGGINSRMVGEKADSRIHAVEGAQQSRHSRERTVKYTVGSTL